MAYWFHRHPLKATKVQNFDALKIISKSVPASKICSDLRLTRAKLLQLLADPRNNSQVVEQTMLEYLELLLGLCEGVAQQDNNSDIEAKLRKVEVFTWTHTICGSVGQALPDSYYELVSIITDFALWYTKKASFISSNEGLSEDEAKDVFRYLRQAAGIFLKAKSYSESKLGAGLLEKHSDVDPRILDAYHLQSLAEAQEVTVARAVELKHKATTVTAVALGTSSLFKSADECLQSIEQTKAAKWRKYLQLKKNIYLAYAHAFKGESLLSEDKCGDAIKSLQEAEKCYAMASILCKEYASVKGSGSSARPGEHQFFLRLGPIIKMKLEKANHENGFIYHQKVPSEVPELETTEIGMASPVEYIVPPISTRWKHEVLTAFQTQENKPHMTNKDNKEIIEPIKEVKDPNTSSSKGETGCIVS